MLTVMITGTVTTPPEQRVDKHKRPITIVRVASTDAQGALLLVTALAFKTETNALLRGLLPGDLVTIAGPGSITRWVKDGVQQVGLQCKVTRVMSLIDASDQRLPPAPRATDDVLATRTNGGSDEQERPAAAAR